MLHLLLIILKIIGITLAAIIGLVLLITALVLLVPVRYRASLSYKDSFFLSARLTWLLGLVSVRLSYEDNQMKKVVRIAGVRIKQKKEQEDITASVPGQNNAEEGFGETDLGVREQDVKAPRDSEAHVKSIEQAEPAYPGGRRETPAAQESGRGGQGETPREKAVGGEGPGPAEQEGFEGEGAEERPERGIKKLVQAVKRFFEKLGDRLRRIADLVKELIRRKSLISDFLHDGRNRTAASYALARTKDLLIHILPRKIKGRVVFGTGDPCTTGTILAGLGIFYGRFGGAISIEPVFTERVIEGELEAKGYLRAWTAGMLVLRGYLNKDIRYLINEARALKESLTKI